MTCEVVLRCYDVSRGLAASLGSALLGQSLEAIWHSGVEVFGREFFYGGGIQDMTTVEFESSYGITPLKLLNLGTTNKTMDQFRSFLDSNYNRFTSETYNLLDWNCNHFANECVKFLLDGKEIPRDILHQHELIQQSPLGATVIGMIQEMAVSNPIGGPEHQYMPSSAVRSSAVTATLPVVQVMSPEAERSALSDTEFGKSVQRIIDEGPTHQAQAALEALEKLASNILKHSTISKYRRIKQSNEKLQTALFSSACRDCLRALGFEEKESVIFDEHGNSEPGFEFPAPNAPKLRELFQQRRLLESVLQSRFNVQPTSSIAPSSSPSTPEVPSVAPVRPKYQHQIEQLASMGFADREKALEALQASNGNFNQALDKLMGL